MYSGTETICGLRVELTFLLGTYLTPSQREAKRRREAYLKSLLEQGIQLPTKGQEAKLPK